MKDLMQITCLVPTKKVREVSLWLEDNGAVSMMVKAYRNGEAPAANGKDKNHAHTGESQQQWLVKHITKPTKATELRPGWLAAGFNKDTIYNAIERAIRDKSIKKIRPGLYGPRG